MTLLSRNCHNSRTDPFTSFEKKAGALKLLRHYERAAGHPLYLLEDGAYRELRFQGEDVKSALAIKGYSDRVITRAAFSTCGGAQTNVLSVHQRTVGDGGPGGITNCIDGEN